MATKTSPTSPRTTRKLLRPEQLCVTVDPQTVIDAPLIEGPIGQDAALKALLLSLQMSHGSYALSHNNAVVVGEPSSGRAAKTLEFLRQRAGEIECRPPDLLLLHNFGKSGNPVHVAVPAGAGREIAQRIRFLGAYVTDIVTLRARIHARETLESLQAVQAQVTEAIKQQAPGLGLVYVLTKDKKSFELRTMSLKEPGKVMGDEEKKETPPEVIAITEAKARELIQGWHEAQQKCLEAATERFQEEIIKEPISEKITELAALSDDPTFQTYLKILEIALVQFAARSAAKANQGEDEEGGSCEGCGECDCDEDDDDEDDETSMVKNVITKVTVLADNAETVHPPVVHVVASKFGDLHGRLRPKRLKGDLVRMDHTLVEPGLIHQASGTPEHPGVIVVDLLDLIQGSSGWHALQKLLCTIKTGRAPIESLYGFVLDSDGLSFKCPDIPVYVRVVITCTRWVNYRLRQVDPEFDNLFRVVAEFDSTMPLAEGVTCYKSFVARCCEHDKELLPVEPAAIARLVEYGSRRVWNRTKVTAEWGVIKDVLNEANQWARQAGAEAIRAEDITRAVKERFQRISLWTRRYQEHLDNGSEILNFDGWKVGEVNALVVMGGGREDAMGAPARLVAQAYVGMGGEAGKVIMVQQETRTSGPSNDHAVAVIEGWLRGTYGADKPFPLTIKLCMEQCLNGIDGNSATLADGVAIISAITGLPVNQRGAITGAMGLHSEGQPIGGLHYKFEGFHRTVKGRGLLNGGHFLVMPVQNLDNLVLDAEVVEANRQGLLDIYAVTNLDEALELFLGRPAEAIHELVRKRLAEVLKKGKKERQGYFRRLFGGKKSK